MTEQDICEMLGIDAPPEMPEITEDQRREIREYREHWEWVKRNYQGIKVEQVRERMKKITVYTTMRVT